MNPRVLFDPSMAMNGERKEIRMKRYIKDRIIIFFFVFDNFLFDIR